MHFCNTLLHICNERCGDKPKSVQNKIFFEIIYNNGETILVEKGETVLVPASLKEFKLSAKGTAKALEVYIR